MEFVRCRARVRAAVLVVFFVYSGAAYSEPGLSLERASGLTGGAGVVKVKYLADGETASGFNAHIVLPEGVSVSGVTLGDLLSTSGEFSLDFNILDEQNVIFVAYSGTNAVAQDGFVADIQVSLGSGLALGLLPVEFAAVDVDPLVNSRHAISNIDGSVSLEHLVQSGSLLVFGSESDFDGDGLPDQWEVENGLDPLVSNGRDGTDGDLDGDGFTNLQEFEAGTEANNPEFAA